MLTRRSLFPLVGLPLSTKPSFARTKEEIEPVGEWQNSLSPGATPTPPRERRVGIAYTLWHMNTDWTRKPRETPWGTPQLGYYSSNDPLVLREHVAWLTDAGVDFLLLDWSNNIDTDVRLHRGPPSQLFIEESTPTLFEACAAHGGPKICFLLGITHELMQQIHDDEELIGANSETAAKLKEKVDQIYETYVLNSRFSPMLETYLGKPLIIIDIGVPSVFQKRRPMWSDPRFTTRFLSAYISDQPDLLGSYGVSKLGLWSWEDRGPPTYPVYDGHPEAMTVVASWRPGPGVPAMPRGNGSGFRAEWLRARQIGPRYVLSGTFNEWWVAEQPSAEVSKDVEPSLEFGRLYLDIISEQGRLFKAGR
jgi:hypothetical protein